MKSGFYDWAALIFAIIIAMTALIYSHSSFKQCVAEFKPMSYCAVKTLLE